MLWAKILLIGILVVAVFTIVWAAIHIIAPFIAGAFVLALLVWLVSKLKSPPE